MEASTNPPPRILVADDEPNASEFLGVNLSREGYQVLTVADGPEALDRAAEGSFDLVILGTRLPGLDGFEVCKRLRAVSEVPIFMLSDQDSVAEQIKGLDLGADDYVTKPFDIDELRARIRAILRRRGVVRPRAPTQAPGVTLDRETRSARRAGCQISLTIKEFDLLELLRSYPGQVLPRQTILDCIWNQDSPGNSKLLEVYVCRLRSKLDDRPPRLIKTIWGIGYMWQGEE